MIDFAVSFLNQCLPVLTNSSSDFARVGSNLSSFIPRGSNQWNCTHISASLHSHLPWYSPGFVLLYFCFRQSWYTAQLFPNAFRHSRWWFSVMLCRFPQFMNSGNVCLAQCPAAAAKSSNKASCVTDLINVSATSLKTFFFSFSSDFFFLPSGFL